MKATEYLEKYEFGLTSSKPEAYSESACDLMKEMILEMQDLMNKRHINTNEGIIALLKEFNRKWNALCDLFEKKYGISPLLKDGYKNYWIAEMPELKNLI